MSSGHEGTVRMGCHRVPGTDDAFFDERDLSVVPGAEEWNEYE